MRAIDQTDPFRRGPGGELWKPPGMSMKGPINDMEIKMPLKSIHESHMSTDGGSVGENMRNKQL